jgi:acyl-CoA hydrolase
MRTFMSWQDEYKSKLMTVEEAVKKVKSNDVVGFGLSLGAPMSSCPICTASML